MGTIQHNLWNCSKNVKEIAYTSLVRPKLEYESAAWDPFLKKDISALERVQRKAARFCSQHYNSYANVTDMIKDLGFSTLETRRREFRLTLMYKLTHGLIDIDSRKYFNSSPRESHEGKTINLNFVCHMEVRTFLNFRFFFPRTIADWNRLPEAIVFYHYFISSIILLFFMLDALILRPTLAACSSSAAINLFIYLFLILQLV